MKRSEINDNLSLARDFFKAFHFALPKWAYWRPINWEHCGSEVLEIKECGLGWDVTDFGQGNFRELGLVLFTLRNGNIESPERGRPYCEKVMLAQLRQSTPMLFHHTRTKDIVNRGGGDLIVQLYNATQDEQLNERSRVRVSVNGITYNIKPGGLIRLAPGDSVTIPPKLYNKFWPERSSCVVGEVATPVDEAKDVRFLDEGMALLTEIEEDGPRLHLLCHEYPDLE